MIGSVIAAICCFTPILVVLFGAIGPGAIIGYVDYVLLPALAGFLGLTATQCIAKSGGVSRVLRRPWAQGTGVMKVREENDV